MKTNDSRPVLSAEIQTRIRVGFSVALMARLIHSTSHNSVEREEARMLLKLVNERRKAVSSNAC